MADQTFHPVRSVAPSHGKSVRPSHNRNVGLDKTSGDPQLICQRHVTQHVGGKDDQVVKTYQIDQLLGVERTDLHLDVFRIHVCD